MKKRIYKWLDVSDNPGNISWWVDMSIITLILLNVLAMIVASVEPIHSRYKSEFYYFEVFSVVVFTIEYILRVVTANVNPKFKKPIVGNLRYALTPIAIIDLLAFLPFYLPFLGIDMRLLRILRIFRLFRLFKIVRYMKALKMIARVVQQKKEELVISLLFTLFLLLITSTVMYYVENDAQPENFASIPETMWWGIATLTTVGYGDVYPITALGKLLGGAIALIGIGLFALPAGILASGFADAIAHRKLKKGEDCPTCGRKHSGR